ncbi:MAG: flagellar biosynthesis protein FlhF [Firmicutes bacterium]|nr:flagellar biosynthesis protein FlhF [Bacillota bacterium]
MRIKRYTARTINEALDAVRRDLGSDAVILHTRKIPPTWLGRLLRLERFEVIAALDSNIRKQAAGSMQALTPQAHGGGRMQLDVVEKPLDPDRNFPGDDKFDAWDRTKRRQSPSKKKPKAGYSAPGAPGADFIRMHEYLLDSDMDPELAETLIRDSRAKWREAQLAGKTVYELIFHEIATMFPTANGITLTPDNRKVVALVGPTGVGKTTTLAKIGALFAIFGQKKVVFITADTYRVAAMEQLRTYAEIIDVPLEVVYTPQDMREAIHKHTDADLVLIDTAGRNPRSDMSMAELRAILDAAQPDETHLVISMNTRTCDLFEIVDRFTACGISRLIFSKLDETIRLGAMLTIVNSYNIPISYVTYGQNVPQDIRAADPGYLAKCLLDVESVHSTMAHE